MNKNNMKDLKSKDIPSTPELLADKLREVYNDLSKAEV
jgi:hypothetical protein